jgi:hypothetical protein
MAYKMSEPEHIWRAITLKKQAIPLIKKEIVELEDRFVLIRLFRRYQEQIRNEFDSDLSERIDCITRLLENRNDR